MTTTAKQKYLGLFFASILVFLTGCGGGSSDGSDSDLGTGTGTGTGTGSGTGTGTDDDDFASGEVASVHEGAIPGYHSGLIVTSFVASNNGLYMQMFGDSSTTILKLHGNPIFDDWSSASFSYVRSFAPANPHNDQANEISFYWAGGREWGLYTANTGLPGFTENDDISIKHVAAGGREGIITPRPWVVANDNSANLGGYSWVYQDDGQYNAGFNASDRFSTPAHSQPFSNYIGMVLLAHPTDPHLFLGVGDILYVFSASGIESGVQFIDHNFQSINQFLWYDGELWIGIGNEILRRTQDGNIYKFAEVKAGGGGDWSLPGRFCINGGEVFTVDGEAINIANGTVRSWVRKGSLSITQQTKADFLLASLSAGIFCSPDTLARVIYATPSAIAPGVIRMIEPL